MTGAVISRGLHGWPRQDLAQRRKGAKTVLAGELNLCGLLAVGLLTFVFSTWRRGEETRNNHQAGFAALRSLREKIGCPGLPRQDLAQRRKGAKTVLAGELNLCGLLAVGLLTFVFSTWRRGEETRNNHQAGSAALRSLREKIGYPGLPRQDLALRRKGAKI